MARHRTSRIGFGRRLIGWIAAYALVLQATFAGVVATQLAATKSAAHAFEICLTDPDGNPAPVNHTQHQDCALYCKTVASGTSTATGVAAVVVFPIFVASDVFYSAPIAPSNPLRRVGLGSRAPPAA